MTQEPKDTQQEPEDISNQPIPEPEPPSMTINDMVILAEAIDVAFKRGAFGAQDSIAVGKAYKNLIEFIDYHSKK